MKTHIVLSIAALALITAGCSTVMPATSSGFLSTAQPPSGDAGTVITPSMAATSDSATIAVRDVEWRAGTSTAVTADEQEMLQQQLRVALEDALRKLPANRPARGAVVRAAITRVDAVSPGLNAASALLLFVPLDRGGAAVEIEAIDPVTGKQIVALSSGYYPPMKKMRARFTKLAPAGLALEKLAGDFGQLLATASTP